MNSQIFPGSIESLNHKSHQDLLRAALKARAIKKAAGRSQKDEGARFPNIGLGYRQPNLFEPAISAALTVLIAMQLASIVAS